MAQGHKKHKRTLKLGSAVIEHYVVGEPRRIEQLRADRRWFADHRAELTRQLPNRFLAIVGQQVVDSDSNRETLARRVYERSEAAIFMPYTGEAADTGTAQHVSPRVVDN